MVVQIISVSISEFVCNFESQRHIIDNSVASVFVT